MSTLTQTTTYTVISCGTIGCGVRFALDDAFMDERQKDHGTWYCPNGHSRYYPAESDIDKYRRLYKSADERATRLLAERDQAEASRRAWKGQTTRLRNRTAAGECPFCGQHLRDLQRHIGRIHPDEPRDLTEAEATT